MRHCPGCRSCSATPPIATRTSRRVGQADRGGHAPHLPVAPFAQGQFQPGIGHGLAHAHGWIARPQRRWRFAQAHARGQGRAIVQRHAIAQGLQLVRMRRAFNLHQVGLVLPVVRIGEPVGQGALVGEQQQAFAVVVQPPSRVDLPGQAEFGQRAPPRRAAIGELAQHVEWFVEGNEQGVDRRGDRGGMWGPIIDARRVGAAGSDCAHAAAQRCDITRVGQGRTQRPLWVVGTATAHCARVDLFQGGAVDARIHAPAARARRRLRRNEAGCLWFGEAQGHAVAFADGLEPGVVGLVVLVGRR